MDAPQSSGDYVATVTSRRGYVVKVYAEAANEISPAGYLLCCGSARLVLWPLDLIPPVREALAARRDIDMRRYKKDQRAARKLAHEQRHMIVTPDEDAEALARELGLL